MTTGDVTSSLVEALAREPDERYVLRLFVVGSTPRAARSIAAIRSICERHLAGRYELEVVDLNQQPERAEDDDVVAVPTLIKELPLPVRRIVGEISEETGSLVLLNLEVSAQGPRR